MAYFNYNQSYGGYRQGPMVCFPVQGQESGSNQGGLQGEISMPDGSTQSVICFSSQPQPGSQGQQGNGQAESGGQGQSQTQEGMPALQDILEQFGQAGNQGQQQGGQGQEGLPTPQDILEQFGQGASQGQQQGGQGQGGVPMLPGLGGSQGGQGGIPAPPGMFGPGAGQGQRACGYPQAIMPYCIGFPVKRGFYW